LSEFVAGAVIGLAAYEGAKILMENSNGKVIKVPITDLATLLSSGTSATPISTPSDSPLVPRILPCHILDSAFVKTGTWTKIPITLLGGSPAWHGLNLSSSTTGDAIDVRWEGVDIWPRIRLGPAQGIMDVFIDDMNTPVTSLDCYDPNDQLQMFVWGMDLVRATHHARFVVKGTKNAASSSNAIEFNGIVLKFFQGSWQIFAYPESTTGISGNVNVTPSNNLLIENDDIEGTANFGNGSGAAITGNVDFVSQTISLATKQNVEVVCRFSCVGALTWKILRDGIQIATGTASAAPVLNIVKLLDLAVLAGNRTYSLQFTANASSGIAYLNLLSVDGTESDAQTTGAVVISLHADGSAISTSIVSLVLSKPATVYLFCYFFCVNGTTSTATLKRGTTTLDSRVFASGTLGFYRIPDILPAGSYTWTLASSNVANANSLVAISNGG
jgi:hypothetical protein